MNSGDAPVVYYRGFTSFDKFFVEWLERFVPRNANPSHRYYKTGRVFWGVEPGDWFLELCLAGYKGEVTRAKPDGSVATHKEVVRIIKIKLIQHFIGVTPDGVWGAKSRKRAEEVQLTNGLVVTGQPENSLLTLLLNNWINSGMKIFLYL